MDDGPSVGPTEFGICVGVELGRTEGTTLEGPTELSATGVCDGVHELGWTDGIPEVGAPEGPTDGLADFDGNAEFGFCDGEDETGWTDGCEVAAVGRTVGLTDGQAVVGEFVGMVLLGNAVACTDGPMECGIAEGTADDGDADGKEVGDHYKINIT